MSAFLLLERKMAVTWQHSTAARLQNKRNPTNAAANESRFVCIDDGGRLEYDAAGRQ